MAFNRHKGFAPRMSFNVSECSPPEKKLNVEKFSTYKPAPFASFVVESKCAGGLRAVSVDALLSGIIKRSEIISKRHGQITDYIGDELELSIIGVRPDGIGLLLSKHRRDADILCGKWIGCCLVGRVYSIKGKNYVSFRDGSIPGPYRVEDIARILIAEGVSAHVEFVVVDFEITGRPDVPPLMIMRQIPGTFQIIES